MNYILLFNDFGQNSYISIHRLKIFKNVDNYCCAKISIYSFPA